MGRIELVDAPQAPRMAVTARLKSVKITPLRLKPVLLINVGQLLTLHSASANARPRRGPELKELGILREGAVLCVGGKIVSVGTTKEALRDPWLKKNRSKVTEIDCDGRVVLPGFV